MSLGQVLCGRSRLADEARTSPARLSCSYKPLAASLPRGFLFFFVLLLCTFSSGVAKAQTFGCTPPMSNDIVCENTKAGSNSANWDISGAGDSTIQGFATDISVNQGQTISFKINTNAKAYTITIFRLGYYGGTGA